MAKVDLEKLGTHDFYAQVQRFNSMYRLGNSATPVLPSFKLLGDFYKIVKDELSEAFPLLLKLDLLEQKYPDGNVPEEVAIEILAELTDWLCDVSVYCHTFGARCGLPMKKGSDVIMQSNFSKLGADGEPSYDPDTGKVLKGPNYWRPEPTLEVLIGEIRVADNSADIDDELLETAS